MKKAGSGEAVGNPGTAAGAEAGDFGDAADVVGGVGEGAVGSLEGSADAEHSTGRGGNEGEGEETAVGSMVLSAEVAALTEEAPSAGAAVSAEVAASTEEAPSAEAAPVPDATATELDTDQGPLPASNDATEAAHASPPADVAPRDWQTLRGTSRNAITIDHAHETPHHDPHNAAPEQRAPRAGGSGQWVLEDDAAAVDTAKLEEESASRGASRPCSMRASPARGARAGAQHGPPPDIDREIRALEAALQTFDRETHLEERLSRATSPRGPVPLTRGTALLGRSQAGPPSTRGGPATPRSSLRSPGRSPRPGEESVPSYMRSTAIRDSAISPGPADRGRSALARPKTSFRLAKAGQLFAQGLRGGGGGGGAHGAWGAAPERSPGVSPGPRLGPGYRSPPPRKSPGMSEEERERERKRKMLVGSTLSQRMLNLASPRKR